MILVLFVVSVSVLEWILYQDEQKSKHRESRSPTRVAIRTRREYGGDTRGISSDLAALAKAVGQASEVETAGKKRVEEPSEKTAPIPD